MPRVVTRAGIRRAPRAPAAASEIARLEDLFVRTHGGDPWHGSSLRALLAGVGAGDAAAHPVAGAHSIWEIVLHVIGWRGEVLRRLAGAAAGMPEAGDWPAPPPATAANWRRTLAALDESHEAVVAAVRGFDPGRLDRRPRDRRRRALGTGVSFAVMLHGLAHHDVYHAGQIALLAKALRGAAASGKQ